MKILYGVQGTGNGHISRATAVSAALARYPDTEITWLVSGRPRDAVAAVAHRCLWRRGLTFAARDGRVGYLNTLVTNNFLKFCSDVRNLHIDEYDCVLTDFEPVVAWSGRRNGLRVTGISHQYAFLYPVPGHGGNLIGRGVIRYFAPASRTLGLHWHHFGYPILPPVLDLDGHVRGEVIDNKVVVYLPFEDQDKVIALLRAVDTHEFYVYGSGLEHCDTCNIHTRALSRDGFKKDLVSADSVICNTGFELISECLSLGVRVLTKPLAQQTEQLSNARALEELEYATVVYSLTSHNISEWLQKDDVVQIDFPRVHEAVADWLVMGQCESNEELASRLWQDVRVRRTTGEEISAPTKIQLPTNR